MVRRCHHLLVEFHRGLDDVLLARMAKPVPVFIVVKHSEQGCDIDCQLSDSSESCFLIVRRANERVERLGFPCTQRKKVLGSSRQYLGIYLTKAISLNLPYEKRLCHHPPRFGSTLVCIDPSTKLMISTASEATPKRIL